MLVESRRKYQTSESLDDDSLVGQLARVVQVLVFMSPPHRCRPHRGRLWFMYKSLRDR